MNTHPANSVFRAVQRMSCSNHRRDSEGWPLGNCIECTDYRAKMDAWYMAQVLAGEHRPGAEPFDRDVPASGAEDYTSNPRQSST